jgi:hypothetical protein
MINKGSIIYEDYIEIFIKAAELAEKNLLVILLHKNKYLIKEFKHLKMKEVTY